eukprot:TRINITY_DN27034_c0_g1_i1.p1 TRINITY_DN27034_c0_g1~~TRINITY_DN27034_c0_g1_i1.p1  ORF type:complete len:793 (+),score=174.02 TRINITY_DN27034_c0_g1_i1:91-2469(+)
MFRRTVSLLHNSKFPKAGGGSIVWLAPCAKSFKKDTHQQPSIVFSEGNKVEPSVFTLPDDPTVIVVSAQKVDAEFFQAWRKRLPSAKQLTLIRRGTSLGSIDMKAAAEHDIEVIATPGINSPHVAQYVVETLDLKSAVEQNEKIKAVVIGFGTVGRCVVDLMNGMGVRPSVLTNSSMLPDGDLSSLQAEKYNLSESSATLCSSLGDALDGATHVAVCCPSPADGKPLLTVEHIEQLLSEKRPGIRICCIARPDVFSTDAIVRFVSSTGHDMKLQCTFDYGDAVLAPVRDAVNAKVSDEARAVVQERLAWTTKAMHSEGCKQDMDEAVLRILNPDLPNFITIIRGGAGAEASPDTRSTLGVLGGPSAWMQAFLHLKDNHAHKVIYYRPEGGKAIWESSGRQISLREKVTKFTPLLTGPKNLEVSPDDDKMQLLGNLVRMGTSFLYERYCDAPHDAVLQQVETSIARYRELNTYLASVGEKPIWIETGRLVIAGSVEQTDLFKYVREWREKKGLVDTDKTPAAEEFLKKLSAPEGEVPLLFNSGYVGYPLAHGGFITPDAEAVVHRALAQFGSRFRTVKSNVKSVTALSDSYLISSADTSVTEVGKIYMSPGATHVVEASSQESSGFSRLCPPVVITGFSAVVRQRISRDSRAKILSASGLRVCSASLRDIFTTHPAAFMTDDFELTLESVEEGGQDSVIRWRVTGGATINSTVCKLDPEAAILVPVRRFLAGGDENVTVETRSSDTLGGYTHCSRQCGPQFSEQIVPWGVRGRIALSWGHWGVTLAGQNMWDI